MKKKLVLLVSFICAFALAFGVFLAGCSKDNKDEVTVTISQTEISLTTGGSRTLTASASDGSEIVWSTSDAAVATVANGKVTAVKAGTATVTATVKDGTAHADCAVTVKDPVAVTFVDADGETVANGTELEMRSTLQLAITTSDNSTASTWLSSEDLIATVENGLVTGVTPGDVTITVRTSSGVTAELELKITAVDGYTAIKNSAENAPQADDWWYFTSAESNRNTTVTAANVEEGVVTFNFNGSGNWFHTDIQLGHKAANGTASGWKELTGKIAVSDIVTNGDTPAPYMITIHGTEWEINEDGEVSFCVYYNQISGGNDLYIEFAGTGTLIYSANIRITDLHWDDHDVEALKTPSFTLEGEGDVAIIDTANNPYGVLSYQIGLFKLDNETDIPDFTQSFDISGGMLDTSTFEVEEATEVIVKIKAAAQPGYEDSPWSTATNVRYIVEKHDVIYDLKVDGTPEGGADAKADKWVYWAGEQSTVSETPKYVNGTVTLKSQNTGWATYGIQLFKNYSQYARGVDLHVTMNINSTHEGKIIISDNKVDIHVGDNPIELFFKNPARTLLIQMGGGNTDQTVVNGFPLGEGEELVLVYSNIVVEPFTPEALKPVTASYATEGKVITVTPNTENEGNVASYEVGFFKEGETKEVGTALILEDGTFSDIAIKDYNNYTLKVRAVPQNALYTYSAWSEAITTGYVVANGSTSVDLTDGGEGNSCETKNTWFLYSGKDNNLGVNVSNAKLITDNDGNETITLTYASNGSQWWGVQLFKKNSALTAGTLYELSLDIEASVACTIQLCGTKLELTASKQTVTVYYTEGGENNASFSMQFGTEAGGPVEQGTFTLSDIKWAAVEQRVQLEAPTIAIDADTGVVTITGGSTAGVKEYVAGFFTEGATTTNKTVIVKNGEAINVSMIDGGTYTVKIMARAESLKYIDSDWSAEGVEYTVAEHDISYEVTYKAEADINDTGKWYYWNEGYTVNSANYADNKLTIDFTHGNGGWYGLQLFMKLDSAKNITFTIHSSAAGHIRVCGEAVELKENADVTVTINNVTSISIQFSLVDTAPDIQAGVVSIGMNI